MIRMSEQRVSQENVSRVRFIQKPSGQAIVLIRNRQREIVVKRKKVNHTSWDRGDCEHDCDRNSGNPELGNPPQGIGGVDIRKTHPNIEQLVIVENVGTELKKKDYDDEAR